MVAVFRYETERRIRGMIAMSVIIAVFALLMIAFFPSLEESTAAVEEYANNLPPAFQEMFGMESLTTIGGFLATELYQFVWVLLLGVYFAYRAASLVAGDVADHRLDLLLATPTSRTRILVERFAALGLVVLVINVIAFPVIYGGTVLIDEPVSIARLTAVHALSVPYLLACGALGLVISVLTSQQSLANRAAIGLVFGLFVLETVASTAGVDWIGYVGPTRYYDPSAILVTGTIDWAGAGILLASTLGLFLVARALFVRADVV